MDLSFYVSDLTGEGVSDTNATATGSGGAQPPASQQPSLEEIASAARAAAASAAAGLTSSTQFPTTIPVFPPSDQLGITTAQQQLLQTHPSSFASSIRPPQSKDTTTNGGPAKPIGMACRACRLRKIRCGGERPRCTYCVKKGYECVLTPHKKRGRPRKNSDRGNKQSERLPGGSDADDVPLATAISRSGNVAANAVAYDESSGMRAMRIPVTDEDEEEEQEEEEEPSGDTLLDGLDIDVRQLWAELTGLQGLDLPPELSALAANSAIQPIDAYPSSIPSIGPSFNLGITQPPLSIFAQPNSSLGGMQQQHQHQQMVPHQLLSLHSSADAGLYGVSSLAGRGNMATLSAANMGGMDMFASNYAFPRQADEGPGSASPLTTPRPQPEQQQQQHQHQQQRQPIKSEGS
ncbi:hypothetical protein LPJ59_004912, partial [Coemansia sp. RSA 2399]